MDKTTTERSNITQTPEPTQFPRTLITVIIPAFNEELGIAHVLESLIKEAYLREAEIIVVDDGSHDKTSEVVGTFERVRLLRHPFNRGYGSAICTGARAAKAEYIYLTRSQTAFFQKAENARIVKKSARHCE